MPRPIPQRLSLAIGLALLAAVVSVGANVRAQDAASPESSSAPPADATQAVPSSRFT